ncbi:MAG TPA: hypothetical protein VK158_00500 [Acidobacteriota bacterium]|nr:hypothetical protein [Acidobacteriota bacterium]
MSVVYPLTTKSFYGLTYPLTESHEMTRFVKEFGALCHEMNFARSERKQPQIIGIAPEPIIDSGLVLTLYAINPVELDMNATSFSEKAVLKYLRANQYSIHTRLYDNSAIVAGDVCKTLVGRIPTDMLQDPAHVIVFSTEKFYRKAVQYGNFKNGELR